MSSRLAEKVILITGGARGQGAAEARLFTSQGAQVVIADVLEREGRALSEDLGAAGGSASFCRLDVTDATAWLAAADFVREHFGRLDVLVNNAGVNLRRQLTEMTLDEWDKLLATNLTGAMLGIRACVPLMKARGGSIVNVGSLAGLMGHPTTAYSAAKWGLRGLTKSAALELARWNIRVNAMHPGLVETPIIDKSSPFYQELKAMTPMHRAGLPEELALAVMFLASDESSFITGIDLPVDGGLSEFGAYAEIWRRACAAADGGFDG